MCVRIRTEDPKEDICLVPIRKEHRLVLYIGGSTGSPGERSVFFRTLADIFVAVVQIAALVVFWWAYKLLDKLTRIAGRIAKDVQAIRSRTAQESPPPQRPQRPH